MEVHIVLAQLLIIIVSARFFGEIASYFKAPSVIGELVAGIVIGPSIFGWVETNDVITILAEIGVILLLFEVGLHTDMRKLMGVGSRAVSVAAGGFIAPFVLGFLVAFYWFDLSLMVSLFVGGTLTATSIGITARTLSDIHRQDSKEGQIVLGAAVLDDILGVVLIAILYEFSISGEVNWTNTLRVVIFISVFFFLAPLLAKVMSGFILNLEKVSETPGVIPSTILALILFFSWLAHSFGAPELLGGFAAGLALSRRFFLPFGLLIKTDSEFSERITAQMIPIVQLFTPVFFVSVGLSLDLSQIDWSSVFFWSFSLTMLLVAIVGKFAGAFLINEPIAMRIVIGMAMVPRGEVGLIFVGLGYAAGVFDDAVYTALVMVIAYTTLLSPFWIKLYYRRYAKYLPAETASEPVP